jgi:hypothetical protein
VIALRAVSHRDGRTKEVLKHCAVHSASTEEKQLMFKKISIHGVIDALICDGRSA